MRRLAVSSVNPILVQGARATFEPVAQTVWHTHSLTYCPVARLNRQAHLDANEFQMPVIMFTLVMLGALTSHAAGQDPKSQIRAEIERLTNSLKEKPITDPDYAPLSSTASQALQKAAEALDSSNIYLSLEKLLQAEDFLLGARLTLEKTEAVKSGLPAFEADWKEVNQTITGYNQELRQKEWGTAPAALRALSETAIGRATPLLEGGYGFAVSTKPNEGLFYLGQAQGEATFAQFAASVRLVTDGAPFPRRSILPELNSWQHSSQRLWRQCQVCRFLLVLE